jgi:hypothetical protein
VRAIARASSAKAIASGTWPASTYAWPDQIRARRWQKLNRMAAQSARDR